MKLRVQKWGNSLAFRLPRSFANEVGIQRDSIVELTLREGEWIVGLSVPDPPTLDELLGRVTPDNLHGEVESGPVVRAEVWWNLNPTSRSEVMLSGSVSTPRPVMTRQADAPLWCYRHRRITTKWDLL